MNKLSKQWKPKFKYYWIKISFSNKKSKEEVCGTICDIVWLIQDIFLPHVCKIRTKLSFFRIT